MRILIFIAAACLAATQAAAQGFPSGIIRIIVSFPPGGGNDVYARAIAPKLQERYGYPVIVENKPGAGGNIGTMMVVKSPPDGHTLVVAHNGLAMQPWLSKNVPFDLEKDLAPVCVSLKLPMAAVVNPDLPVRSVNELVSYAKSNPGRIAFAIPGFGTPHHMYAELFMSMTGTKMVAVPYKGAAGMIPDLMSGQVQLMFGALNSALAHIKSGRLRAIGIGERQRLASLADVPAIGESLPGYEAGFWFGLMAPAGTPEAVLNRIAQDVGEIVNLPDVAPRLRNVGFEVSPGSPAQMRALIRSELQKWEKVVKDAGIKPAD